MTKEELETEEYVYVGNSRWYNMRAIHEMPLNTAALKAFTVRVEHPSMEGGQNDSKDSSSCEGI